MQEFEHFKVPPLLMHDLYTDKLIALENIPTPAGERRWEDQVTGANTNGFWLIFRRPGGISLGDTDQQYLATIIQACRRDAAACLFLNLDGLDGQQFPQWSPDKRPQQVWLMGLEPGEIGLPARFPAFQVQQLGETTYLWTPPLAELQEKEAKSRLWQSLKQMFHIG